MHIFTEAYDSVGSEAYPASRKAGLRFCQLLLLACTLLVGWSAQAACPAVPINGCTVLDKGQLKAMTNGDAQLEFQGSGIIPDMGNPLSSDGQYLCAYDVLGQRIFDLSVDAGAPFWSANRKGNTLSYAQPDGNPDGVQKMVIKTGGSLQTVAGGPNLQFLEAFSAPFLVQHSSDNGNCAEIAFGPFEQRAGWIVARNKGVYPGFELVSYNLSYSAGSHGSLSGDSAQTVNHGQDGTAVTALPDANYHFVNWSDGRTDNPRTDSNVTADLDVTANFAIDTYTLTYSAGPNGSISGSSPQTVNHGSSGTAVTAVPENGYHFVGWSDGSTANPRTDTGVTGSISVTASFAINTYTLTYTAGANGSINGSSPQTVNHGSSGTSVTAVPAANYHFVQWSDGNTNATRTDSNVTGNISVTASFAINTYTLTYTAGANGTITGAGPQTVNHGAGGTAVTAVANANYQFSNWSDGSTANPRTDTNVTANISVTANFVPNTYTITYTAGAGGSITGNSTQTVNHGGSGTAVTASPDPGYRFVNWSDGSTANPRTDTGVTSSFSVTANFAINLAAPGGVIATPSDEQVTVSWNAVPNAAGYNLYYSTASITDVNNCLLEGCSRVTGATSPHVVTGLSNGTTYYFRVTATLNGAEGPASTEVSATPVVPFVIPNTPLNDTGLDWCADENINYDFGETATPAQKAASCALLATTHPGQDGMLGRDAIARDDAVNGTNNLAKTGAGKAGFDFTRVCNSGEIEGQGSCPSNPALGSGADEWACTRDNVTGLIWEVKANDVSNPRHRDHTYTWLDSDGATNGGLAGTSNGGTCSSPGNCDTEKFVAEVNALATPLCGARDWRLPSANEWLSVMHFGEQFPAIDKVYFPNFVNHFYWSSTPYVGNTFAFRADQNFGGLNASQKSGPSRVRLVRGGQ